MDTPHPYVTYDERRCVWTLEHDCTANTRGVALLIPGGFEFDLASIPRPLWNIIAPFELSIVAPLVHDWLYRHGGSVGVMGASGPTMGCYTRKDADDFLLDLMEREGVAAWRRRLAYIAVRLFGGSSWQVKK